VTSLGYWLAEEACGNGIMRQSVAACVQYAFEKQAMNRLYIRCATGNERSRRIPEALGFTREGVQRQAEWLYDHFVDLDVYSILAAEWKSSIVLGF
jgi:ribosomal-protein-serine acetyltransferase